MEKNINLELYRSGTGDELYKTNSFIYRVEISKLSTNGIELIGTQFFSFKEFKDVKFGKYKKLADGSTIYKDAELFGAPEAYLIEHNYEKRGN